MYGLKKIGSLFFLSIFTIIIFLLISFFTKLKCITKDGLSDFVTLLIWIIVERACWSRLELVKTGWSRCEHVGM